MKSIIFTFYFLLFTFYFFVFTILESGCAQIGTPTGGPKDTIPPVLINATPRNLSTNFSSGKITFTFDEYVDVQDVQNNLLVSPFPKVNPIIDFKLKTVSVKLKDTLQPNTTYSINFGNAIRDNNEGNPLKDFNYVFSTGKTIDSFRLSGKILLAETGKADSTIIAMLYRNADDSSVHKRKPDYVAKLDGKGVFVFSYLPSEKFKLFALKDGDGGKTYNSETEIFAFADTEIFAGSKTSPVTMYAYAQEKESEKRKPVSIKTDTKEKKLKYTMVQSNGSQDLLSDLEIDFSNALKQPDETKISLTDTLYKAISGTTMYMDSTQKKLFVKTKWQEDTYYKLIIDKESVVDSSGNKLSKTDTVSFKTKRTNEYGSILLRFTNLNAARHPVIQFIQSEKIMRTVPVTATQWTDKLFPPGEYELRVLYDDNNNGIWDPGNYSKKLQPEKAITLDKTLNIRADWENERDVVL